MKTPPNNESKTNIARPESRSPASFAALLRNYFRAMRHDPAHHLGLGDIRLTLGQQEEIVATAERVSRRKVRSKKRTRAQSRLRAEIAELKQRVDILLKERMSSEERRAIAALVFAHQGRSLIRGKHMFRVAKGAAPLSSNKKE